jgi:ElaB/YqjD/DUF883 family membrane-anchored ribosome-binding protein
MTLPNDATPALKTFDELAGFGHATEPALSARALTDLVERNPIPAGAGLMALVTLMARRDSEPFDAKPAKPAVPTMPTTITRANDFDGLKQQIADLVDRLSKTAPVDAAKQRAERAGDAIADGWGAVRDQALDALDRFEPQASAAIKVARENPVWTALIVGAVGALVGSQMLGGTKPTGATETQSDPSADA